MTKKTAARSKPKSAARKGAAPRKPAPAKRGVARGGSAPKPAKGKAGSARTASRPARTGAAGARPKTAPKPPASKPVRAAKPAAAAKPVAAAKPAAAAKQVGAAKPAAPKAVVARRIAPGSAPAKGVVKSTSPALKSTARPVAVPAPVEKRTRGQRGPVLPVSDNAPEPKRRPGQPGPGTPGDPRSRGLGSAVQFARSVAARDSATLRPRDTAPPKAAARVRPKPVRTEGGAAEPLLDQDDLHQIRESLEEMRRDLHATVQRTWRSGLESRDEAFAEMGDFVSASVEKEQIFEVGQSGVETLREVERALERVESGTYGLCESCGGRIPTSRLKAVPHTRFCLECQEAQERGKAI